MENTVKFKSQNGVYTLNVSRSADEITMTGFFADANGNKIDIGMYKASVSRVNGLIFVSDGNRWFGQVSSYKDELFVGGAGYSRILKRVQQGSDVGTAGVKSSDKVCAPITGKIVKVHVKEGDKVKADDLLVSMEAMKMEFQLKAHRDAVVGDVGVKVGQLVDREQLLVELK